MAALFKRQASPFASRRMLRFSVNEARVSCAVTVTVHFSTPAPYRRRVTLGVAAMTAISTTDPGVKCTVTVTTTIPLPKVRLATSL